MDRIIALIDMDCFYVQVEQNERPEFKGKPCGVAQYNPYKGGGLIAVNYEARKYGIKRAMRGDQCKELCPEFHTFFVQEKRGKANLTKYREASNKIFEIILKHCDIVEKASIDEAFLDLTTIVNNRIKEFDDTYDLNKLLVGTYVIGSYSLENDSDREVNLKSWLNPIKFSNLNSTNNNALLAIGAVIVEEIRKDIFDTLGYHCSAGIAHNKTFAKFCCGINKPNKQTVLPLNAFENLMLTTPIQKIRNLGGKLGLILTKELKLEFIGDLAKLNKNYLIDKFGDKTGQWLYQISHGIDLEPVLSRQIAKSVGCSKNFRGKLALDTTKKVEHWLNQLADELEERLEKDKDENKRIATSLTVHITNDHGNFSKCSNFNKYCAKKITEQALGLIKGFNKANNEEIQNGIWQPSITILGISASKFKEFESNKESNIQKFFANHKITNQTALNNETKATTSKESIKNDDDDTLNKSITEEDLTELNNESNDSNSNNSIEIINITNKNIEEIIQTNNKDNNKTLPKITDTIIKTNKKINQFVDEIKLSKNYATNIDENNDYIECDKCKKRILCWNMPEHSDYHFALELSELDKQTTTNNNSKVSTLISNNNQITTGNIIKKTTSNKRVNNENNNDKLINKKQKKNEQIQQNLPKIESYFKKKT